MGRMGGHGRRNVVLFVLLGVMAVGMLIYRTPFQDKKYEFQVHIPPPQGPKNAAPPETVPSPLSSNGSSWQDQRKELLSRPGHTHKVIIFAYMRGGSSIIGETFGHDDGSYYWYEPLDQFYNDYFGYKIYSIPLHITYNLDGQRRLPGEEETDRLAQYFDDMYSCRLDKLPRETLIHPFMGVSLKMKPLGKCIKNINSCKPLLPRTCAGPGVHLRDSKQAVTYGCSRRIDELRENADPHHKVPTDNAQQREASNFLRHEQCMRKMTATTKTCIKSTLAATTCNKQTLQVSKVLRANMEIMERVLQKMPDAYIVHYVRDPRAIAMSVNRVAAISFMAKQDKRVIMTELKMLCKKMKRDIEIRKELEKKYPGVFITLKYEDLVTDTQNTVKDVYSFIDRKVPPALWTYLQKALHNKAAAEGSFSHARRNATATSIAWMGKFPKADLAKARELCKDVLSELDYALDVAT